MPLMRTATIELDVEKITDFELDVDICKAEAFGKRRFLTGVASGILEDADGERVSKNAIRDMARQAVKGLRLVAGSHQQDWHNEIGDAVEIRHDPENDELLVKCELPPEGEDPLADKAWNRQTKYGDKLGFSIGGKLQKAYFELTDTGKKRKVLDGIGLKHFALTKKPAYRQSFALAVAKTAAALNVPADDAFTLEAEPEAELGATVAKMAGWVDPELDVAKADSTVASTPQDAVGNRGTRDDDAPALDVNNDDEKPDDDTKLPQGNGDRHLACPNCGHEFAAPMPAEQDTPAESIDGDDTNRDAHKRAPEREEPDVAIEDTINNLRQLAGVTGEPVEKKDDEPAAAGAGLSDVEKLVAASHEAGQESIDALKSDVTKGFEGVGEVLKKVIERLDDRPAGRKSVARTDGTGTAPRAEVEGRVAKTDEDDGDELDELVGKIAEDGDPAKALAVLNRSAYGVESNIADRPTQTGGLKIAGWSE